MLMGMNFGATVQTSVGQKMDVENNERRFQEDLSLWSDRITQHGNRIFIPTLPMPTFLNEDNCSVSIPTSDVDP